jgi:hypothetical protein
MTSLSGHGFPLARRTGADIDLHPELVAGARRTDPAGTYRAVMCGINEAALPTPYTTTIPPAGAAGLGTVELFVSERGDVDVWAGWLGVTARTRRTADGTVERRAVVDGWEGWRRLEVWAPIAPAALTELDRYALDEQALRVLLAAEPESVHAVLRKDAVLARDAAYPHHTRTGGA